MTDGTSESASAADWFCRDISAVLSELQSDAAGGLSGEAARRRLREHGPNVLSGKAGRPAWRILAEQFSSLMVLLLIAAALVSGLLLGERSDAIVIAVVVVLNAALGFRQEFKAERAMAALKKMTVPTVRVRRGGRVLEVPAADLVPGDVVDIAAGNVIAADCRLIETANLRVQEAALTGEAEPVEKQCEPLASADAPLGDRSNMAFMGTAASYGRGVGVVTATGMQTELGHIAGLIRDAEEEDTVLQRKLNQLSRMLVVAALALIAIVAVEARLVQHLQLKAIFMTAVSMAVAAIPEGLPAAVTISLALGAQRMLKRRALIRRLPAVETLGSVTVICSDKTGTLTQNRMTVSHIVLPAGALKLADEAARGEQLKTEMARHPTLGLVLAGGALCNDAVAVEKEGGGPGEVIGDPTEGALITAAGWLGWSKDMLQAVFPRLGELPFDSERKRMTTLHGIEAGAREEDAAIAALAETLGRLAPRVAFTKGAAGEVLDAADRLMVDGGIEPLTDARRAALKQEDEALAGEGIRVLAVAMRPAAETESLQEEQLVYLGMVGMADPVRPEVPPAVAECHAAGVRPVMITGDHPLIAENIARELNLESPGGHLTGPELARLDRASLEARVQDVAIYARVSPRHKLEIVDALQKNGHVVAMTGDGVNDAPALKEADIGVAMGITGTDVSKEAADMVLQDDNFATIVSAVEEGRIILDNIIRFVRYILASNWAEILVMLAAPLFGLPLPLLPAQILWMNLVTDGLPALALGVEPGERGVMRRPPRSPGAPIMDWNMGRHILLVGGAMALFALFVGRAFFDGSGAVAGGHGGHGVYGTATTWQTMVFTALVFSQLTLALAERSTHSSLFRIGLFSNPFMLVAIGSALVLQLAVVYLPLFQRFFKTSALTGMELLVCLGAAVGVFVIVEVKKAVWR